MNVRLKEDSRLAKNTIALYIRTALTMCISLYTYRVILMTLGIVDYGIYNVIGGIISMLGLVNISLSGASSRFITYSLGLNDKEDSHKTFNSVMFIHVIFAIVIIILSETLGLWFLNNKLVIPQDRLWAANWVFQAVVLSTAVMFCTSPFSALVIAHEKMIFFAYVSVFDKILNLCLVLSLFLVESFDKLIAYSIIITIQHIVVSLIYVFYCYKHFEESSFRFKIVKYKIQEIFSFAGWVIIGNIGYLGYTQGLNILLNMFFGPIVNAARGIMVQVQGALLYFTQSFQTAINPQITKNYASGNIDRMHKLFIMSSRFGFYLMLIISLPILIYTDILLNIWLDIVPEHTTNFVRIIILIGLINTLKNPSMTAIHSTGDIKNFQLIESSLLLTILPLAYLGLEYFSISAECVFVIYLFIEFITQIVRLFLVYKKLSLSIKSYYIYVINPIIKVLLVVSLCHCLLYSLFKIENIFEFIVFFILNAILVGVTVLFLGLQKDERMFVRQKFKIRFNN